MDDATDFRELLILVDDENEAVHPAAGIVPYPVTNDALNIVLKLLVSPVN